MITTQLKKPVRMERINITHAAQFNIEDFGAAPNNHSDEADAIQKP